MKDQHIKTGFQGVLRDPLSDFQKNLKEQVIKRMKMSYNIHTWNKTRSEIIIGTPAEFQEDVIAWIDNERLIAQVDFVEDTSFELSN